MEKVVSTNLNINNIISTQEIQSNNEASKDEVKTTNKLETSSEYNQAKFLADKLANKSKFENVLINHLGFQVEGCVLYKHYRWLKIV